MALRLAEIEPRDYMYVCTPTGDELPEMFAHWQRLGELLGSPIVPVMRESLDALITRQNALPNWRQRWCTRMLKIEPFRDFLAAQRQKYEKVITYVGLRADEPEREGGDYSKIGGIEERFPLREWGWGLNDVLSYLVGRDVSIPERTDCAKCFFQTLGEWWVLWREHPAIYAEAIGFEDRTGHTFRSPGRDTWPASLRELAEEFARGRIPMNTNIQTDAFKNMRCRVCRI